MYLYFNHEFNMWRYLYVANVRGCAPPVDCLCNAQMQAQAQMYSINYFVYFSRNILHLLVKGHLIKHLLTC